MREIKQIKCSACQNEYYDDQDTCPFCGHRPITKNTESKQEDDFFSEQKSTNSETPNKSNFTDQDIIILIVLAIFFWPAAIIYLIVKLKK